MKMMKLFALGSLLCGSIHAATITISPGFGSTNGLLVTTSGVAVANQYIAIGAWNGTTFTQFGSTLSDTGTVNGVFSATSPTSVNSAIVHLYVGASNSIDLSSEGSWVIFRTSGNTLFPSDVSSALASATVTFSNFTTAVNVAQSSNYTEVGARTINFVPEPSSALLGALGALGLLRRRRI